MDKAMKATFLGRDNVVLNVWYSCCAYVVYDVHVSSLMLCACAMVYI